MKREKRNRKVEGVEKRKKKDDEMKQVVERDGKRSVEIK